MSRGDLIQVEVCYARPDEQVILKLDVNEGATLREAIERSGILQRFPEIDLTRNRIGRWSHLAAFDDVVRPGDRIEIYRPLIADPKEMRRQRAAAARK
ncbi:RnfH family protein [Fontimonas sp. SYSU GA230001]|uniref:RnfH family protein n=1 Tax=Fontimonas sp. SYSU GA230001 TaxID=3142450 RepID=UPI0032B4A30E